MVHIVACAALGAVFLFSAVVKLVDLGAWTVQAAELGVPRHVAMWVPWLELAVGAGTAARLVEPLFVVVAVAVLVAFTAVIVENLRRGRRPSCACFGRWSTSPISLRHVARNAVFVGVGVIALATG